MLILSLNDLLFDMLYLLSKIMTDKMSTKLMHTFQNKDKEIKSHNLKTGLFSAYTFIPACRFSCLPNGCTAFSVYSEN